MNKYEQYIIELEQRNKKLEQQSESEKEELISTLAIKENEIEDLKKTIEENENEKEELISTLAIKENETEDLKKSIEDLKKSVEENENEKEELISTLAIKESEIEDLKKSNVEIEKDSEALNQLKSELSESEKRVQEYAIRIINTKKENSTLNKEIVLLSLSKKVRPKN